MSDKDYKAISRTRIIEFPLLPADTREQFISRCPDYMRIALQKLLKK